MSATATSSPSSATSRGAAAPSAWWTACAPATPCTCREPRNLFELSLDAPGYIFVAGGIGITPILSMIR